MERKGPSPRPVGGHGRRLKARLVIAFCFSLVFCFAPLQAWGLFTDYSPNSPTEGQSQPLVTDGDSLGDPIYAQSIPEGTYEISARTTSYMCMLYASASDCSASNNPERALLQVSGGTMIVHCYISRAYTFVYFGTAAEAASLTDESGTDASAYLAGDPPSGYVPHYLRFEIDALNVPIDIATYGGNGAVFETSKWWWRQVVFRPSQELLAAMNGGESGGDDTSAEQQEDQPQEEGRVISGTVAVSGSSGTGGTTSASSSEGTGAQEGSSSSNENTSTAQTAQTASSRRAIVISPAEFEAPTGTTGSAVVQETPRVSGLTLQQVLVIAAVLVAVVGAAYRTLSFRWAKRE